MKQQQELSLLKNFERDSKWFYENVDKLRKQGYTEKFVAIKNNKPIASGKEVNIVIKKLDKQKENSSFLFIEFVHPEGYVLLL